MAERLRLRLAGPTGPVIAYRTTAEAPVICPRDGCGGLLRDWPEGRLCAACGRVFVIGEALRSTSREANA